MISAALIKSEHSSACNTRFTLNANLYFLTHFLLSQTQILSYKNYFPGFWATPAFLFIHTWLPLRILSFHFMLSNRFFIKWLSLYWFSSHSEFHADTEVNGIYLWSALLSKAGCVIWEYHFFSYLQGIWPSVFAKQVLGAFLQMMVASYIKKVQLWQSGYRPHNSVSYAWTILLIGSCNHRELDLQNNPQRLPGFSETRTTWLLPVFVQR